MRRSYLVIGAIAVVAILFTGCGGGGGSKKTATPTEEAMETYQPTVSSTATAAAPGPTVRTVTTADLGVILTDSGGYTLYQYANDTTGVSNCVDACAGLWPPLTVSSGEPTGDAAVTGTLATIERSDGSKQVTYNGVPLYRYSGDTAPDRTTGEGVGGVWHVVKAQ